MTSSATPDHSSALESTPSRPGIVKKTVSILVVLALLGLGGTYAHAWWQHSWSHEETDDAFTEGHVVPVAPRINGQVIAVHVKDNQEVKKGDLLVEIDPRDYEIRLERARATLRAAEQKAHSARIAVGLTNSTGNAGVTQASSQVAQAQASVAQAQSAVSTSQAAVATARARQHQAQVQVVTVTRNWRQQVAQVESARAEATRTATDVKRYQQLYAQDEVSRQQLDAATTSARIAAANLRTATHRAEAARAQIVEAEAAAATAGQNVTQAESSVSEAQARSTQAQAQVGDAQGRLDAANTAPQQVQVKRSEAETADADVKHAQVEVKNAELQLSYCRVHAAQDGRVARKSVEVGAYVREGQALMALVAPEIWVLANFKETQLKHMRAGQKVDIAIDAFPGHTLKGHVDSFQAGSGARFSMMPPENATGNYVKVVQRVPVKIVFDESPDVLKRLGPGMSVLPSVHVR